MKKLFTLLAFAILISCNLFAQENSLLWKISGKDLKQDSYLLGTLHIMCTEDFQMPSKVSKAIENVDQVVFELNLFDSTIMAQMQEIAMKPNKSFFDGYDATKLKVIDSVLRANQLPIQIFDMMSPSTVTSLLALKSFGCANPMEVKSMEKEVYDLAASKKIDDLETVAFQTDMLNTISTPTYFYDYLSNYAESVLLTRSLVEAYKTENLEALSTIISNPKWMPKDQYDIMLTNRNQNWLEILPAKIKDTKTLIAVGAAHLIGDTGMIKLLQDAGYTVTPVY